MHFIPVSNHSGTKLPPKFMGQLLHPENKALQAERPHLLDSLLGTLRTRAAEKLIMPLFGFKPPFIARIESLIPN